MNGKLASGNITADMLEESMAGKVLLMAVLQLW